MFFKSKYTLEKLNNNDIKKFFENYVGKNLCSVYKYRNKYIDEIYEEEKNKIISELKNQNIFITFDETTDLKGRNVFNIVSGICGTMQRGKQYFISSTYLDKLNSDNVFDTVINFINQLYDAK